MEITVLDVARKFIGVKETLGPESNPLVLAMLQRCDRSVIDDQVAWCAAYCSFVCWLLGLPSSLSLSARSWLLVGSYVVQDQAQPGDIVILTRGVGPQPGPSVIKAPGHVGFVDHWDGKFVHVLGGNQNDKIDVAAYPVSRVLGVRRLT